MGKRKNKRRRNKKRRMVVRDDGSILVMSSEEHTRALMPHYNGWQCRGGVHGDTKYNRRATKNETRRILNEWD